MRISLGIAIAFLSLAAAGCEAPEADNAPEAELSTDPNTFRAEGEPAYTGEWASQPDLCSNAREVWTIEARRLGMKRQRFCVFDPLPQLGDEDGQGWSASARCHSDGRASRDFLFFRVEPSQSQMRVTINDQRSVELVRCPSRA